MTDSIPSESDTVNPQSQQLILVIVKQHHTAFDTVHAAGSESTTHHRPAVVNCTAAPLPGLTSKGDADNQPGLALFCGESWPVPRVNNMRLSIVWRQPLEIFACQGDEVTIVRHPRAACSAILAVKFLFRCCHHFISINVPGFHRWQSKPPQGLLGFRLTGRLTMCPSQPGPRTRAR